TPVAVHLERERADRDEQPEQQRRVDGDRRREHEHRYDGGADDERGREEVVRGLVDPDREDEEAERSEHHDRGKACELQHAPGELEHVARRVHRHEGDDGDRRHERRERDGPHDRETLADAECDQRRDAKKGDDLDHASRAALWLTIRNAPASATTTWSQASSSVSASCGPGTRRTRSCVPVSMSSAPSEPRTAPRAVSRIAMPEDRSQNAATSVVTPLGSAPRRFVLISSPVSGRRNTKAAAVVAAATTVAIHSRHPGSSP